MKHTKGPWEVSLSMTRNNGYLLWDDDQNYHENVSYEEQLANANLMKSAPDLLEALIQLRNEVYETAKRSGWAGNGGLALADLAVAKALGQ